MASESKNPGPVVSDGSDDFAATDRLFEVAGKVDWFEAIVATREIRAHDRERLQDRKDVEGCLDGIFELAAIQRVSAGLVPGGLNEMEDEFCNTIDLMGSDQWERLLDAALAHGNNALIEQMRDLCALQMLSDSDHQTFDGFSIPREGDDDIEISA